MCDAAPVDGLARGYCIKVHGRKIACRAGKGLYKRLSDRPPLRSDGRSDGKIFVVSARHEWLGHVASFPQRAFRGADWTSSPTPRLALAVCNSRSTVWSAAAWSEAPICLERVRFFFPVVPGGIRST